MKKSIVRIVLIMVVILLFMSACVSITQSNETTESPESSASKTQSDTPAELPVSSTQSDIPTEFASSMSETTSVDVTTTSCDIVDNMQEVVDVLTVEYCIGKWRKASNANEGFSEYYSFWDNGSYRSWNSYEYSYGEWMLTDNTITLSSQKLSISVEATSYNDVTGLLINGELYLNTDGQHQYYQAISGENQIQNQNTKDFSGSWKRTDVIRAYNASLEINFQTETSFLFSILAFSGGNSGYMEDEAYFIAPNQAFCYIESTYLDDNGLLFFTLIGDDLVIDYDGNILVLGFGNNVTAEGIYTKGEPNYTNANIVDEYLPTQEIRDRMRALVGDDAYEQIIFVMEDGSTYITDEYTYSGFVNSIGVGVDIIIKDDGKIYCLGYYLDRAGYTLYTNDVEYKDKLPDFMRIERDNYELSFVYVDI